MRVLIFVVLTLFSLNIKSNIKVDQLLDSASTNINTPKETTYLKKALTISDSKKTDVKILFSLTRNYYNRWHADSVNYYGYKGLSLAESEKLEDYYIDILSLLSFRDIFSDEYENAYEKGMTLFKYGKENDNNNALISSYEVIGLLYRQSSRDDLALNSYIDGFEMSKIMKDRPSFEIQFLNYIIDILLGQGKTDKAKPYINEYFSILDNYRNGKYSEEVKIPMDRCLKLGECFMSDLNFQENNLIDGEKHHLKSAEYSDIHDAYVNYYYNLNNITYFQKVKHKYKKALSMANEMLVDDRCISILLKKANIQKEMNLYDDAIDTYKEIITIKDSIYNNDLNRHINELRTKLDINKLELEKNQLQARKNDLMNRIYILLLISFVIIVIMLIFFLAKTAKVKNNLKKSQKDLKKAMMKAEESNRLKTIFIHNMSHEIRTPLNAIVGFSSLLTEMPEQQAEFAKIIEDHSNILLKLVDDMLNISLIEANKEIALKLTEINPYNCCKNIVDTLQIQKSEDVEITLEPYPHDITIVTDELRLHQILLNLMTNAMKFTDMGEIKLSYEPDNNNNIIFYITDTGVGIPDDKHTSIFDRFVKLNEFKQGAGLGLYICKTYVEALGGNISIDNNYKKGAKFIVRIPIKVNFNIYKIC